MIGKEGNLNYVISTPGRRKTKRVVHVNLLKEYCSRDDGPEEGHSEGQGQALCQDVAYDEPINCDFDVKCNVKLNNSNALSNLESKLVHLSAEQKYDIKELLCEFRDLCSDVPSQSTVMEHDIVLIENTAPYRMSPQKKDILREEVQFLLKHDLVEKSKSEWASPCILVPKADGSMQMCTDYRQVNARTRSDSFPLPRIDDIIDSVGNAMFLTKIDLLKGYYQVPLTDNAKSISAFVTSDGLYQYRVMPFGLRNAPCTFQRLITNVIDGLENVYGYLDDIITVSNDWQKHMLTLRGLFQRLREAHLTINLVKSEFGYGSLSFLGHVVGRGRVAPIDAKVAAINDLPVPSNRRQLLRFIGMAGYYRHFCQNFSDVIAPLSDLVSPKRTFVWSERCQEAFNKVKWILTSKPVLKSPDFSKPFLLQVDASDYATGAVLLQESSYKILHPVCYLSSKFKAHQCNYSTIEKEALALLIALEKFEVYLGHSNSKIIVYSDHNPLTFVNRMKNKNQRLTRWCLALQPYDLEIRHIKGCHNVIADALSRALT